MKACKYTYFFNERDPLSHAFAIVYASSSVRKRGDRGGSLTRNGMRSRVCLRWCVADRAIRLGVPEGDRAGEPGPAVGAPSRLTLSRHSFPTPLLSHSLLLHRKELLVLLHTEGLTPINGAQVQNFSINSSKKYGGFDYGAGAL